MKNIYLVSYLGSCKIFEFADELILFFEEGSFKADVKERKDLMSFLYHTGLRHVELFVRIWAVQ